MIVAYHLLVSSTFPRLTTRTIRMHWVASILIYPSKDDESGELKPVKQWAVPFVSYADGKQIGTAKVINGTASQAVSESIVIAKIGNQTIKIAVK